MGAPAQGQCTVWVPLSQRYASRSAEGPEQRSEVSRVMAELLGKQDRILQAGSGTTEDGSLQNNGGLERVERGKPSHPTEEESDERNRCKTQNHKTEAFFTQCVIRLQQLLLQDAVVAKI